MTVNMRVIGLLPGILLPACSGSEPSEEQLGQVAASMYTLMGLDLSKLQEHKHINLFGAAPFPDSKRGFVKCYGTNPEEKDRFRRWCVFMDLSNPCQVAFEFVQPTMDATGSNTLKYYRWLRVVDFRKVNLGALKTTTARDFLAEHNADRKSAMAVGLVDFRNGDDDVQGIALSGQSGMASLRYTDVDYEPFSGTNDSGGGETDSYFIEPLSDKGQSANMTAAVKDVTSILKCQE